MKGDKCLFWSPVCAVHIHTHTKILNLPSPYFPFRHNRNVCNFPPSSYSFLFFPSFYTKQRFQNPNPNPMAYPDDTVCLPLMLKKGYNNNTTAYLTTFLNNERLACVIEYFDLTMPELSEFPKLPWCLLEECVRVCHVCFHLLVSAQTKMTHATFYDVTLKFNKV